MRLGDPLTSALHRLTSLPPVLEGRGQPPSSTLLQPPTPRAAAPSSRESVRPPLRGWRPRPLPRLGKGRKKGAIRFSSLALLRTENPPLFCLLILQLLDTRRWVLFVPNKKGNVPRCFCSSCSQPPVPGRPERSVLVQRFPQIRGAP